MGRNVGVTEVLRDVLPDGSRVVFETLTHLGDWRLVLLALAVIVTADFLAGLVRPTDENAPLFSPAVLTIVATVFGALALALVLEVVIDAPVAGRSPQESETATGFPSGHATVAAVFWGSLATWTSVGTRRTRVGAATAIVAVVAVSRLALGVHYLVDVAAGVALGAGYVAVVVALDARPGRAFALALTLSALAVGLVGTDRALLSLLGTLGTVLVWRLLELPPVRTRLRSAVARLR
jgi:membrane-associated phospholipid phosphatase